MQKERAPLFEKLAETADRLNVRFHVPGHKARAVRPLGRGETSYETRYQHILELDMTEISGLDDLHHPEGAILEAQQLAAACFGAEETFWLVGGSTAGNMAMIMASCDPGDLLLLQRNVHKSAIHACMLAGCQVAFLTPEVDEASGLAAGVSLPTLRTALKLYPHARAVFLTNPNYYGMGNDLREAADLVHAHGMPLLVDEAHGAHYGFHPDIPGSAMAAGADAAVQSTHKMLTAMTMGAMLHVQGERLDRERLKQRLAMLQSSSPSYPIMASLDWSRRLMHTQGSSLLEAALERINRFRRRCEARGLAVNGLLPAPTAAYATLDPFKLTLRAGSGLSGFQLQERLEGEGCIAEMADAHHVVLALSWQTSEEDLLRLEEALVRLVARGAHTAAAEPIRRAEALPSASPVSEPIALRMPGLRSGPEVERVPLEQALGRRAAEMWIPYPPGIPLVYPGETVDSAVLGSLRHLAETGARFQGVSDSTLRTMLVER